MALEFMAQGAPPAGPPPDLAALLGGGGAPVGPDSGLPPGLQGPTPGVDSAAGGSELDALDDIAVAIDAYIAIPTVDESERLIAEKMATMVQQLKAQNEKMADELSGANPALRKALGPAA